VLDPFPCATDRVKGWAFPFSLLKKDKGLDSSGRCIARCVILCWQQMSFGGISLSGDECWLPQMAKD
jgi:hypothetical protein